MRPRVRGQGSRVALEWAAGSRWAGGRGSRGGIIWMRCAGRGPAVLSGCGPGGRLSRGCGPAILEELTIVEHTQSSISIK